MRFGLILGMLLAAAQFAVGADLPQRRTFLEAEKALEQDDIARFRREMKALRDHPLAPYLWSRFYRSHPRPLAEVAAFLQRYADTRYARPVRIALLKYLAERRRWRDFLRFYQDVGRTEIRCHYAWALHRLGRDERSWRETKALWLVGRSQPKSCDRLFAHWRRVGRIDGALIWRRFRLSLDTGKPRLAGYLAGQLPPGQRRRAEFWLEVHRDPAAYICRSWPKAFRRDGEIFVHALQRLARRDLEAAIRWWRRDAERFSLTAAQRAKVRRAIGLRLAWRHDPRAWDWLAQISDPLSDEAVAAWRVRAALRQRQWHRVRQALARLPAELRDTSQWRYWAARVSERQGEAQRAAALFRQVAGETGFYGFLAADRLGLAYAIDHRPVEPSETTLAALARSRTIRAIEAFLALDRYWEARREWWYLLEHADRDTLLAAARLAQAMGWRQMAIFAVARAEHWQDLDIRFPVDFFDQVRKYASARNLDPAYVYGIIRRESAFDERVRSPAGARGLMQLMPATARRVARRLDERWRSPRSLEDPDTNLRYGTAYFRSLLEEWGGHFVLATAAYNAGPHRVKRWLPAHTLAADIWIETIPFRETRRYVRAVLSYAVIYRKRLGLEGKRLDEYTRPVPGAARPEPLRHASEACRLAG